MPRRLLILISVLLLGSAAGCEMMDPSPPMPPIETRADSLALQAYEAWGGPEAWHALPYLRFDFGAEQDGQRQVFRRHLWNRGTGAYRVEWTRGADSNYVVLFDVDDYDDGERSGEAYLNGQPLDSTQQAQTVEQAYRGFINDTYWLMAPTKMLDPGVQRTYVPDSSQGGNEVVRLAFDSVGLTPGDTYWMHVDPETGRVERWTFNLEGGGEGTFRWTGYQGFDTEAGSLYVATRKEALGGGRALLTDNVAMPRSVPDSLFTSPRPLLGER